MALTLIEKLYGLKATDLGAIAKPTITKPPSVVDPQKSLYLVLDIAPPLVTGSVLNAAVLVGDGDAGFTSAFDKASIRWSVSLDDPGTLVAGGAYAAFQTGGPGEKSLLVHIEPPGEIAVDFKCPISVREDQSRLRFADPGGTPEGDPRTFKMFVYHYRSEILRAARLTGWPKNNAGNPNGICPRLLAAVFYFDYLQNEARPFADPEDHPTFAERCDFGDRIESRTPTLPVEDYSLWTQPLGLCRLPLLLVRLADQDPADMSLLLTHSHNTCIFPDTEQIDLIAHVAQSGVPATMATMARLYNLTRFRRSALRLAARFLWQLRGLDSSAIAAIPDKALGPWTQASAIQDTDVRKDNQELVYFLSAFDRLRRIGREASLSDSGYARQVIQLATSLPAMDLYFNVANDYGGYDLSADDNDAGQVYAGEPRAEPDPPHYVQNWVEDLRTLGFATAGKVINGSDAGMTLTDQPGEYHAPTTWAVREMQIHAGMRQLAQIDSAHEASPVDNDKAYEEHLNAVDNPVLYCGPLSGVANLETRVLVQYWKRLRFRCPVVISARDNAGIRVFVPNLWFRRDPAAQDSANQRMFARDYTGYFHDQHTTLFDLDPPINGPYVTGYYAAGVHGGPNMDASKHAYHSWDSAQVTCESLTGAPCPPKSATLSTMRVVMAVGKVESGGFFDVVNAWDGGYISVGLCHWTLRGDVKGAKKGGELGAYLAYLKTNEPIEFNRFFRRFGLDLDAWVNDGKALFNSSQVKYITYPRRDRDFAPSAELIVTGGPLHLDPDNSWLDDAALVGKQQDMPQVGSDDWTAELEYLRTWPWFYRFVMAGRTALAYRQRMWDMARIRIRDVRRVAWERDKASANYLFVGADGPPATFADIFTSEKAWALIHRWHVNWPITVVEADIGDDRPRASHWFQEMLAGILNDQANTAIFGAPFRHDVTTWHFPNPVGAKAQEDVLVNGIQPFVHAQIANDPNTNNTQTWTNLDTSLDVVNKWDGTLRDRHNEKLIITDLGRPSTLRDSFQMDDARLPPSPVPGVP